MPRFARECPPGSLQHVIARIVNREHRLSGRVERQAAALNRSQGRLGPVFAGRPRSIGMHGDRTARFVNLSGPSLTRP